MADRVERRILAAIRPLDAMTGLPVTGPLTIDAPTLVLARTRSGVQAVLSAPGLAPHVTSFQEPPEQPAAESLAFPLTITDPAGGYLPVAFTLRLPRPWDPANGLLGAMQPVEVRLPRSAAADPAPGWACVIVRVADQADRPLRGARVEVTAAGAPGQLLGWAVTSATGEALVAVPGLPALRTVENDPDDPEDDVIVTADTAAELRAVVHEDGRWPVDPALLAAGGAGTRAGGPVAVTLRPGRTESARLTVDMN